MYVGRKHSQKCIVLDSSRNDIFKNIPTKCLKEVSDIYRPTLQNIWNKEIINSKLLFSRKKTVYVEKYKPVSVLPTVSKVFERIMQSN